jgi:hypothetical protein
MVIFLPYIRQTTMATIANKEKISICMSVLMPGISQIIMPVIKAETDIHKKKNAGMIISITKQITANTHQYQKTKANSLITW